MTEVSKAQEQPLLQSRVSELLKCAPESWNLPSVAAGLGRLEARTRMVFSFGTGGGFTSSSFSAVGVAFLRNVGCREFGLKKQKNIQPEATHGKQIPHTAPGGA